MATAEIHPELAGESQPEEDPPTENWEPKTASDAKPPEKLYDINRIQAFKDVPFVIERVETEDMILTYGTAAKEVETVLQILRQKIPPGSGIALRIAEHTPASCLLILT